MLHTKAREGMESNPRQYSDDNSRGFLRTTPPGTGHCERYPDTWGFNFWKWENIENFVEPMPSKKHFAAIPAATLTLQRLFLLAFCLFLLAWGAGSGRKRCRARRASEGWARNCESAFCVLLLCCVVLILVQHVGLVLVAVVRCRFRRPSGRRHVRLRLPELNSPATQAEFKRVACLVEVGRRGRDVVKHKALGLATCSQ